MNKQLMPLLLSGAMAIISAAQAAEPPLQVTLAGGVISGTKLDGTRAWLGIPYAKPPTGDRRWQPPQDVEPWHGVKETRHYGDDCLQKPFEGDAAPSGVGFSEDCLTINVWRPDEESDHLPVMVWIYGGGYVNGGSSPAVYSGQAFARQGIVFVSFNYRVGRFGFFAHPALAGESLRGNYGLMDQLAALRWVQQNIQAFGGDKNNVTLFGESAGGMSIHSLLTTPLSRGLFQKAIIESGSGRHNKTANQSWQQAEHYGVAFAAKNGISATDASALASLRQLPAAKLVDGLNMATVPDGTYSGPMIDGKIIQEEPQQRYDRGDFIQVPLLVGVNSWEIGFPPAVTTLDEALKPFPEEAASRAQQAFAGLTPQVAAMRIAQYKLMTEPARYVARVWAKNSLPVWSYRFAYVADSMKNSWGEAPHASEIPYVFDTMAARFGQAVTPEDQRVADIMHRYWVNFAKTGNPNAADLPNWEPYDTQKDNLLSIPPQGAAAITMMPDPLRERLDLIEAINR
ncbi:carboxylesterase/lipase family protein [Kosakonia sp. BK9b]